MQNSDFQFSNPVLTAFNFHINQDFNPPVDTTSVEMPLTFQIDIKKDSENTRAVVLLSIEIGQKDDTKPFYITATEQAEFKWSAASSLNEETLLKQNAPALLLGYLRPIVATVTASSQFSVYNIPFIDFTQT